MKRKLAHHAIGIQRRAPRGARGLKLTLLAIPAFANMSRPTWGAWIETLFWPLRTGGKVVAPHVGRVD